jgi:zinc transport system substrate-binding protein
MHASIRSLLASTILLATSTLGLAAPKVVVSIKPLHSIVAAVMGKVAEPSLLLSGVNSEHNASFTAQQIALLGQADVVFIIGHDLEVKLGEISGSESVDNKTFIELSNSPNIMHLTAREGGAWEAHVHEEGEHKEEDHVEGVIENDPHIWLDPQNAKAMTQAIVAELIRVDQANAAAYQANAKTYMAELDALEAEIKTALSPVKDQPYIVFHDAYQYFENRFALTGVGSISDISGNAPSAARIAEVRVKLTETNAICVFREPQFNDAMVKIISENSTARLGILNPLGADIPPGPAAYGALLRNLASNLKTCLGSPS